MPVWHEFEARPGLLIRITASLNGVQRIDLNPEDAAQGEHDGSNAVIADGMAQLRGYFEGRIRVFTLPLDLRGTEFQMRVWRTLCSIPYGETRSYSQIASLIGSPRAVRAVGAANGRNPIAIVVPCHRVIGAGGGLVGYGGGLAVKKLLLELEVSAALNHHPKEIL